MITLQVLETRLRARGTETAESMSTRLHNAREELEYGNAEVSSSFGVVSVASFRP